MKGATTPSSMSVHVAFLGLLALGLFKNAAAQNPCDVSNYYSDATIQAIIAGTSGLTQAQKRAELNTLVSTGYTRIPYTSSSTDVWDALRVLDADPNVVDNVILLYSGASVAWVRETDPVLQQLRIKTDFVVGYSRLIKPPSGTESMSGPGEPPEANAFSGEDFSDLQHLYPTYASVNSARGNRFFATCPYEAGQSVTRPANARAPDTATCGGAWEAPPDVRGDIARTMFYM
eukprot:scaffold631_cov338-Pinguiococcus_pyrenoidosus.AAC.2